MYGCSSERSTPSRSTCEMHADEPEPERDRGQDERAEPVRAGDREPAEREAEHEQQDDAEPELGHRDDRELDAAGDPARPRPARGADGEDDREDDRDAAGPAAASWTVGPSWRADDLGDRAVQLVGRAEVAVQQPARGSPRTAATAGGRGPTRRVTAASASGVRCVGGTSASTVEPGASWRATNATVTLAHSTSTAPSRRRPTAPSVARQRRPRRPPTRGPSGRDVGGRLERVRRPRRPPGCRGLSSRAHLLSHTSYALSGSW